MKFVVTELNNFGRVFRMPFDYPSDFCFGEDIRFRCSSWTGSTLCRLMMVNIS